MSQESRLIRRLRNAGVGGIGHCPPAQPMDYRSSVIAEQDFRRNNLAEELLKIGLDTLSPSNFLDSKETRAAKFEDEPSVTVEQWVRKLAVAALAGAEEVYPELPAEDEIAARRLPPAAQEGAAAVIPAPFPGVRTPGSAD